MITYRSNHPHAAGERIRYTIDVHESDSPGATISTVIVELTGPLSAIGTPTIDGRKVSQLWEATGVGDATITYIVAMSDTARYEYRITLKCVL